MKKWIAALLATGTLSGGALYGADQAQNPYVDKGTHHELSLKSDIPQGERVEIHKDKAQMDLVFWNDEQKISIIPQIPTATFGADKDTDRSFKKQANRPLLSKKMEYRSGDVTAFIEPKAGTENEFDIDFTLNAPPATNVFTYKIEGADDFDFFYQPELTPEEIAEGAERPENVIGSYAVYHKHNANHQIGKTNYTTGKAFHIYRPKAIDANGAEVWAELLYSEGVLAVTVPEKWLETAAYPVVVDPTFGTTAIGGTAGALNLDRLYGTKATLTEDGTVSKITVYNGGGTNGKGVLVASSTRTIVSNGVTASGSLAGTAAWKDLTYGTQPTLTAGDYIIMHIQSATDADGYYYDASSPIFCFDNTNSFATPTDPTDCGIIARNSSIYATYTASASAAPDTTLYLKDSQTYLKDAALYIKN